MESAVELPRERIEQYGPHTSAVLTESSLVVSMQPIAWRCD